MSLASQRNGFPLLGERPQTLYSRGSRMTKCSWQCHLLKRMSACQFRIACRKGGSLLIDQRYWLCSTLGMCMEEILLAVVKSIAHVFLLAGSDAHCQRLLEMKRKEVV